MKSAFKNLVAKILWWQVAYLRSKHKVGVLGVVGSIGKTSTKYAIAQTLEPTKKVLWQEGNYNDILSVPLVFFDQELPNLYNPLAWVRVFFNNLSQIKKFNYDVVVLELGTDAPGQISEFKKYLKLDIAVVTAITPEHMENFNDIDDVAKEELSICEFADKIIINTDLVDKKYLQNIDNLISYGQNKADYQIVKRQEFQVKKFGKLWLSTNIKTSIIQAYSLTSASVVADLLLLTSTEIKENLKTLKPVPGRLQILKGIKNSTIIDDTYNASPDAVIASLQILYDYDSNYKIALLGNMNELGKHTEYEHKRIGEYCSAKKLDLLVLVGPDIIKYTKPVAEKNGCLVESFDNPYDAGAFIKNNLHENSVILAKGSQNNVYMEEALKELLVNKSDISKLVRQNDIWLNKKHKNFKKTK